VHSAYKSVGNSSCIEEFQGTGKQSAGSWNRLDSSFLKQQNTCTRPGNFSGSSKSRRTSTDNNHIKVCHFASRFALTCATLVGERPLPLPLSNAARGVVRRVSNGNVVRLAEMVLNHFFSPPVEP
jgi:hypothetical protein